MCVTPGLRRAAVILGSAVFSTAHENSTWGHNVAGREGGASQAGRARQGREGSIAMGQGSGSTKNAAQQHKELGAELGVGRRGRVQGRVGGRVQGRLGQGQQQAVGPESSCYMAQQTFRQGRRECVESSRTALLQGR